MFRLGERHTEEAKKKMSLARKGKPHPHLGFKGKKISEEQKRKISLTLTGRKQPLEQTEKIRLANTGRHHTEEAKQKDRLGHLGKHPTKETRQKISLSLIKRYKDEQYLKKYIQSHSKKPTKPEKKLDDILQNNYPSEFKYVGNYKFWIDGKNPDFINVNGKKLIIEMFGDYYHRNDDGQKRITHFAKYGYKTLIVWEHELENQTQLLDKLNKFCGVIK